MFRAHFFIQISTKTNFSTKDPTFHGEHFLFMKLEMVFLNISSVQTIKE
jgi:hypothetical protein